MFCFCQCVCPVLVRVYFIVCVEFLFIFNQATWANDTYGICCVWIPIIHSFKKKLYFVIIIFRVLVWVLYMLFNNHLTCAHIIRKTAPKWFTYSWKYFWMKWKNKVVVILATTNRVHIYRPLVFDRLIPSFASTLHLLKSTKQQQQQICALSVSEFRCYSEQWTKNKWKWKRHRCTWKICDTYMCACNKSVVRVYRNS